jgi:hypothetical protein
VRPPPRGAAAAAAARAARAEALLAWRWLDAAGCGAASAEGLAATLGALGGAEALHPEEVVALCAAAAAAGGAERSEGGGAGGGAEGGGAAGAPFRYARVCAAAGRAVAGLEGG